MKAATVSGPSRMEFGIELGGQPRDEIAFGFIVSLLMIGEGRRDMAEGRRQQGLIRLAAPGIATCRERAERVAVVTLPSRDKTLALRLAGLEKILPRDLDRRFDCFRPATDEIDISQTAGLMTDQLLGELFRGLGGEERGVRIDKGSGLLCHRREHARVLMPEA